MMHRLKVFYGNIAYRAVVTVVSVAVDTKIQHVARLYLRFERNRVRFAHFRADKRAEQIVLFAVV